MITAYGLRNDLHLVSPPDGNRSSSTLESLMSVSKTSLSREKGDRTHEETPSKTSKEERLHCFLYKKWETTSFTSSKGVPGRAHRKRP